MHHFSTTTLHTNGIRVVDRAALDAMTSYSIAFKIQLLQTSAADEIVVSKSDDGAATGWHIELGSANNRLRNRHDGNGGIEMTGGLTVGTTHSVILTWTTGTNNTNWYIDGAANGTGTFSTGIAANAHSLTLGNDADSDNGAPVALGHVMIWANYILSTAEREQYDAGVTVPNVANLEYWHRGNNVPGSDEAAAVDATEINTVTILLDPVDDYFAVSQNILPERDAASRLLRLRREPEEIVTITNGWEALEAELMDPIGYSHRLGPTPDALGWGVKDWQRGFGRLKKQVISLGMPKVVSTIGNRRRFQTTFWQTMKLVTTGDSNLADGLARMDAAGADRTFTRTGSAWAEDAGGVVRRVLAGKEKIEAKGILIEESRTNNVLESSFVNGTTGWTKVENTGTATFAASTTDLLFDSEVSAQSGTLTATAATHDVEITDVTASLAGSTEQTLSLDSKVSLASGTIDVFLQNDTTTNWLTASNTWQASRPATAPISVSPLASARNDFTFDTEATASTHTIVLNGNGTVNGTVYTFYHAQVEAGAWASSRIVCEGSAVTRNADSLTIDNASTLAQRIFPVDKFTLKIKFTPQWNSADIPLSVAILDLFHDANNAIRIRHTTDPVIRFVYEHGGTSEIASLSSPGFVAGTEYEIVARKGSTSGELDETNNTMTVFLDGTKGATTTTAASNLTESAGSYMQIGALNDNTRHANGWIGEIMVSPIVFSDEEISGGLP